MKLKYYLYCIIAFSFFINCNNIRTINFIKPDIADILSFNKQNKLIPDNLLPKYEYHILYNNDTFLSSKNGVFYYIPKDAFIKDNGESTNNYQITITEIFDLKQMLLINLQTIYDNQILETSGMFSINAWDENGKEIELAKNKKIFIEFNSNLKKDNLNIFYNEKKNNSLNWINPQKSNNYLINIPFPKDNWLLNEGFKYDFDTSSLSEIIDKSYICTKEFIKWRLPRSFFDSSVYFKIYMNNIGKNLYEADSLCMVYENMLKRKWPKKGSKYQKNDTNISLTFNSLERKEFFEEKLTKPKIINTFGIDLNQKNARELLKQKGLMEYEIDEAYVIFYRQKNILASFESERNFTNFFEINRTGWFNFDQIANLQNLIEVNSKVEIINSNPNNTSLYYIFNDRKSLVLGNYNISANIFHFPYVTKIYNTLLPSNSNITILGISFTEKGVLIDSTNFKMDMENKLKLKLISFNELNNYLSSLLKAK